jgi:hypothetical protein
MRPLLAAPAQIQLSKTPIRAMTFSVRARPRCLRAIAASGAAAADLKLSVLDPTDRTVAQDELVASYALALAHGPFCVSQPGSYRVLISAETSGGQAMLQVWEAE